MPDKSLMQLFAYNSTQALYWDFSETQQFYLFTNATNSLSALSSPAAKTWFQTFPSNTSAGITAWGLTLQPNFNKGQQGGT
jgi:hypothetical protein